MQKRFQEVFYYDETSPTCLRWRVSVWSGRNYKTEKIKAGDVAGIFRTNTQGGKFCIVKLDKRGYVISRVIWQIFYGEIPEGMVIDHLDGNPYNNKLSNLEMKTSSANNKNKKKRKDNTTGVNGVCRTRSKYPQYMASWIDSTGTLRHKTFSVYTYGEEGAKQLAIAARQAAYDELREFDTDYTDRHGT